MLKTAVVTWMLGDKPPEEKLNAAIQEVFDGRNAPVISIIPSPLMAKVVVSSEPISSLNVLMALDDNFRHEKFGL